MKLIRILQKKMWEYNYSSLKEMKAHKDLMIKSQFDIEFESEAAKRIIYSQKLTDII